ncbi:hypothetical protein, partial [Janthinobacterium sp. PC23-8]|uniref:hypothetical protein n=1 Tax=Janthinobacterium sp. PC23-8 TaxID=2012679 RepID=UPI000BD4B82B
TPGVLTVKPTEALQSTVASVIAAVNLAPSQGNMVQADMVSTGQKVDSKVEAVAVAKGEPEQGVNAGNGTSAVNTPAVRVAGTVTTNVLPGLQLSVIDTGLRMPVQGGNTSVESQ